MWHGYQLYRSPYHFAWTCGDLECGGTVDDYTATKEGHEFLEAAEHHAHLTPESLATSQAVVNASALEQSDGDTPPAQAQVTQTVLQPIERKGIYVNSISR